MPDATTRRGRAAVPDPLDLATLILADEEADLYDVLWALGVLAGSGAS